MSAPLCPCDGGTHPKRIANPPGLAVIDYRVGDFGSFRHALLLAQPGETNLHDWRPGASGDLAVQMVEWWAYVCDVLTFYNWRILTNGLLRSADEADAVNRIVRLLGYRPRPGIGAAALVALVADGTRPVAVPAGFQLLSKPAPGQAPQTFELDAPVTLDPPSDVVANPTPDGRLLDANDAVTLAGTRDSIKVGEWLLLAHRTALAYAAWARVEAVEFSSDPSGAPLTRVRLEAMPPPLGAAAAQDYELLRGLQTAPIWHFGDSKPDDPAAVADQGMLHCTGLVRPSNAGERVLVRADGRAAVLTAIESSNDVLWWRNDPDNPGTPPAAGTVPYAVLHSLLGLSPKVPGAWNDTGNIVFDWRPVGTLVCPPPASLSGPGATVAAGAGQFPSLLNAPVLVEDANGLAVAATANASAAARELALSGLPAASLAAPLTVHLGVAPISRGFSVSGEILGDGDASQPQQEFKLQKAPVTYLAGDSRSGEGYQSTVRIWVDGVEYHEVPTLYAQPPGARVFATREDDEGFTHVRFGSPLPTGAANVVASYRIESGAALPGPGDVALIASPQPGVARAAASVMVTPGSDPDAPGKSRARAPLSVLTFGRAVSGDDFETIAAMAPGVARARASYGWDSATQRAAVKIYVGDTPGALAAARDAIARTCDPNRPAEVLAAQPVACRLLLSLIVDAGRVFANVEREVRAALIDPQHGLFGPGLLGIGAAVFESQLMQACLGVAGVKAVHGLRFDDGRGSSGPRFDPGEGGYYDLRNESLSIANGEQHA